jgi:cysteine-rich repeat protein
MSYCHLLAGGLRNIDLLFGSVVSARIGTAVAGATCLVPVGEACGDGVVGTGEECDDRNRVPGDGCSPFCRIEGVCGNGVLEANEACDDGNRVAGDGCSPTCMVESPCGARNAVLPPWLAPEVTLRSGLVTVDGRFRVPSQVSGVAVAEQGARVVIETASGVALLDATLPSGDTYWIPTDSGWTYRDYDGSTEGIRRLAVRDATADGVPMVEVSLTGRAYNVRPDDLPLAVTVVLGDASASDAGMCGRQVFATEGCEIYAVDRLSCR